MRVNTLISREKALANQCPDCGKNTLEMRMNGTGTCVANMYTPVWKGEEAFLFFACPLCESDEKLLLQIKEYIDDGKSYSAFEAAKLINNDNTSIKANFEIMMNMGHRKLRRRFSINRQKKE